jgi:G3E family GTPase
MERIPVTILTGFLGAGKTTLLNRMLRQHHGLRLAVIENEFGSESVDAEILVQDDQEQIVQLDNGCLCCNVRGDLLRALADLAQRRAAGQYQFERVVIETSGLADPGPVAQSLSSDAEVAAAFRLDAIVTVVDAVHGVQTLADRAEARAQVAYADRILVSKMDVAPVDALERLRAAVLAVNPEATLLDMADERASLSQLLEAPGELTVHSWDAAPAATHDPEVRSISFVTHHAFDPQRLEYFLAATVDICGVDLFRCKGVLWVDGCDSKVVLQGVQLTMRVVAGEAWPASSARRSKIVLIGRDLPVEELRDSLRRCLRETEGADTPGVAYRPATAHASGWLL